MSTLIKSTSLALALATLTFGAGAVTAPSTAEAKKKGVVVVVGGGHHHHHRHRHGLYLTSGYIVPSCSYLYGRWQDTGSFYWKKRYYECRGWW
jgi:co-chaperonin GroES (HSP10)